MPINLLLISRFLFQRHQIGKAPDVGAGDDGVGAADSWI